MSIVNLNIPMHTYGSPETIISELYPSCLCVFADDSIATLLRSASAAPLVTSLAYDDPK